MRDARRHPSPLLARSLALVLLLVALTTGAFLLSGNGVFAASTSTTVTANVVSAVSLGNACAGSSGWDLGTLAPGVAATTSTVAGACQFSFGSSNDTAQLRMYQRDATGAALTGHSNATMTTQAGSGTQRMLAVATPPANPAVAYAVNNARVYSTTNSGASWTNVTTPASTTSLQAIAAPSATTAYAVGSFGAVERTLDGSTWTNGCPTSCPVPPAATVSDVSASSTSDVWITANGNVLHSSNADGATPTWAVVPTPGPAYNRVTALSSTVVYATGTTATIGTVDGGATWFTLSGLTNTYYNAIRGAQSGGNDYIYMTNDGGRVVRIVRPTGSTAPASTSILETVVDPDAYDFTSLSVLTKDDVEVIGELGQAARSTNASSATPTWTTTTAGAATRAYGIARSGSNAYVVGNGQVARFSSDGGSTWVRQPIAGFSEVADLQGLAMVDAQHGWAVGTVLSGMSRILHTSDGSTWTAQSTTSTQPLLEVSAWDTSTAVAVGLAGTILRTTDSGATWTTIPPPAGDDLFSVTTAIGIDGSRVVYAVGANGRFAWSTDGGATWQSKVVESTCRSDDVGASGDAQVVLLSCRGTNHLWRSLDAGATWTMRAAPNSNGVRSIRVLSSSTAVIGLAGAVLARIDALDAPSFAASTITTISTAFSHPYAIDGYDQRHLVVFADGSGGRTEDGTTWTNVPTGTGHAENDVSVVDANLFWVVGENGKILRSVAPGAFSDFAAGTADWSSGASTSTFGVCVQAVGGSASPVWPVDTGNTAGLCEPLAGDAWQAVPTTSTKVARTLSATQSGTVDFVWGARAATSTPPGEYRATVTIEALAPDA